MGARTVGGMALASIVLLACTSGSTTSPGGSLGTCSPLDGNAAPIALANILGAGRHADGTIYVLDDGAPGYRAFVSQGTVLQRKEVSGSGGEGGGAGPRSISATVSDAAGQFALRVEQSNGAPTKMGIFRGELQTKSFEIGVQGDVLELVGADVIAPLELRNLPGDIVAEHDATTQDGHRIFVTRPKVDWGFEDFRVFYGTPERMTERRLTTASRGSTTYITFDLDGVESTAIFPSPLNSSQTAQLRSGQTSQPMTVLGADAGAPGAGLTFFCL